MDRQYVGIDFHRRRSVIVRVSATGEKLSSVRVANDPVAIAAAVAEAGPEPEVVIEATYGWYWVVDLLQAGGAHVHLANPQGLNWGQRRVKNDERDAIDLADMLRLGRLPEAWIASPATRELRELVRYRAKLVGLCSGLKAQVHAVMAKEGVLPAQGRMFGPAGNAQLEAMTLGDNYTTRVASLSVPSSAARSAGSWAASLGMRVPSVNCRRCGARSAQGGACRRPALGAVAGSEEHGVHQQMVELVEGDPCGPALDGSYLLVRSENTGQLGAAEQLQHRQVRLGVTPLGGGVDEAGVRGRGPVDVAGPQIAVDQGGRLQRSGDLGDAAAERLDVAGVGRLDVAQVDGLPEVRQ